MSAVVTWMGAVVAWIWIWMRIRMSDVNGGESWIREDGVGCYCCMMGGVMGFDFYSVWCAVCGEWDWGVLGVCRVRGG